MDDVFLANWNTEEQKQHLHLALQHLQDHGLLIKPAKCVFGAEFLGHQVDANNISPLEEKVQSIRDFPQPTLQRQLCQFLGLMNFYHPFLAQLWHTNSLLSNAR